MSALAFAEAGRGWEDAGRRGVGAGGTDEEARPAQPRLFALPGGAVEDPVAEEVTAAPLAPPPAPAPAPVAPEPAPRPVAAVRTLDEVLTGAWTAVAAGQTAECPLCAGPLRPRWSAGHGAVGGRCADCGTIVD
jgi:hypothetical protein